MAETKSLPGWVNWLVWLGLLFTSGAGGYSAATFSAGEGEQAKVAVKAPETARVGQLVVLDASESYVDAFKWKAPSEDNFIVIEDGKRAFFSAEKPGAYTFWVAGALNKTVDLQCVTITVDGFVPPDPGPTGLEAKIRSWLKLVRSDTWKVEAAALSASFRGIGQQVANNIITTPENVIKATALSNKAALGNSGPAWAPFGEELRKELNARSTAGQLADMRAHAILWEEIGTILAKVASEK
jgi:hypothetical protein